MSSLSEATRAAMEDLMASGNYEYQSEFAKTHQAKGRAEGRTEGRAEGEARGEAKGRAEGEARSVLTVLDARGLLVSAEQKERIAACTDLELLGRWLRKAVTARLVEELFEP